MKNFWLVLGAGITISCLFGCGLSTHQFASNSPAGYQQLQDGRIVIQGDILLTPQQAQSLVGYGRALISNQSYLHQSYWNGGVVPYTFDSNLTNPGRIQTAIAEYSAKTTLRWIPRTTEADFVTFRRQPGAACYSNIGRVGGQQFIDLDDGCLAPQVIHEMGHAIGMWHEQTRVDRDGYITLHMENVMSGFESAFQQSPTMTQDFGAYDYGSIMHYDSHAFSKNGQPTITRKNGSTDVGNASTLSSGDLAAIVSMYGGSLPPSASLDMSGVSHAIAAAPASGAGAVKVWNADNGAYLGSVDPFPGFGGGVSVALGDVDGDGVLDVICGAGNGGGPRVIVFSGRGGAILRDFFPYEGAFRGGVFVAAGDLDGDRADDIVTGTGVGGGPRVTAWNGRSGGKLADFFAYESTFRGGVLVATGDFNGDGRAEVVTGTGPSGGPRVRVVSLQNSAFADFFAYESSFRGGVIVGAADLDGDGRADILTGTGPGGGPRVTVRAARDINSVLADFFAGDPNSRAGVNVAGTRFGGQAAVVTGAGPNGASLVQVYSLSGALLWQQSTAGGTGANVAAR